MGDVSETYIVRGNATTRQNWVLPGVTTRRATIAHGSSMFERSHVIQRIIIPSVLTLHVLLEKR